MALWALEETFFVYFATRLSTATYTHGRRKKNREPHLREEDSGVVLEKYGLELWKEEKERRNIPQPMICLSVILSLNSI